MFSFSTRLYPITDTRISRLSHADQVARLSAGGARLIQLRDKHLSPREFFQEAEAAVQAAQTGGARIIINDRVDIALALKADGVHLGQDDLPPAAARKLLGPDAIIGYSTHSVAQVLRALEMPIDYVAFGPIFPTKTKMNPESVVGLDALLRVREVIGSVPLVAIGGITLANAPAVISAGADAVAVISAVLSEEPSISENTSLFLQLS